jgi:drug/metabolite transporter, DME family
MSSLSARRGALYVSIAALAWGTGGAAGALLFAHGSLDPVAVSFWRYLLGAGFLLAFLPRLPAFPPRVLVTGVGMAVYQAAYFLAIAETGVTVATMVTMGATPVLTAVGGRLFLNERLGRAGTAALAVALTGLLLLSGTPAGGSLAGVGYALASAVGYAAITLHSRRHSGDPQGTAVGGFLVAALVTAPFALATGIVPELTAVSAGLLLFLGAIPTALAYRLFFRALGALRASTVSTISLGEAAGAAVLGVLVFGERLTAVGWAGCALLLAAVVVLTAQAST